MEAPDQVDGITSNVKHAPDWIGRFMYYEDSTTTVQWDVQRGSTKRRSSRRQKLGFVSIEEELKKLDDATIEGEEKPCSRRISQKVTFLLQLMVLEPRPVIIVLGTTLRRKANRVDMTY